MKFNHFFLIFTAIFITSCGGGGGGGSDSGPPPTPAATVSLSSSASSVSINTSMTLTWSSSNASSCSASGAWSGSKATSGNESVEITSLGDNSFTLSCSGSGGAGQSSVTVTGGGFSGVLVDGYIRDANIYLDTNANFIQDTDEASTTTDSSGGFKIGDTEATVVSKGGIDVDSNNTLENLSLFQKQNSGLNFRAVTPITSVDFYLEGSETINTILGIENSINIYSIDPIANMNDSDSYKHLFEKGSQITALVFSIQSAINDINSVQETSETYFEQLAKTLESQYSLENEVVDIESSSFVDAYVEAVLTSKSVNLGTANTANIKTSLNSLLPIISVRNETTTTTAISNFVTGKFITDFKEIAKGSASSNLVNAYASDVNSLIAADQLIDITDLVIEISLADDSASLDEDKTVDIAVLANDTLLTHTYTLFLEFSAPSNGQAILNPDNSISYIPHTNFNGNDSFTYTVTIENKSGSANVNIQVNPINDKPTIEGLSNTFAVDEGKTEVTSISASDVDGDTLTYSLSGADASSLSISSSGVITFSSAPDYETKTSYSVTVNVTDGTETTSQDITISINDISDTAPVINNLPSSISITENETAVLTVSASDPDEDTLTYSLSGTDASSLSISSSGVITFNSAPDYETKTSYSVTVNVSGGGETTSQALAINITNVNDIFPVISNLASLISIDEGQTAVVSIAASDAEDDTLTYSLTGTDAGSLSISSSGVITFNSAPDYETKTSYSITVNVSDGTNTTSQALIINITNVNEGAPVISGLASSISIDENETAVVTVSASDSDGDTLTYSLTGTDASSLSISSSGVITFNSAPDYETKTSYSVTVNVSDGTDTTSQALTINISNINDNNPVINDLASSISVNEGQTSVVTVSASDVDGDTLTYSLTGTDASSLSISSSGVITFNSAPDFETKTSYSITVNVSDGTNTTSQALTINITNVNEGAPVISNLASSVSVDEGQTSVVTVSASDSDGDTLTYSLTGTDGSSLSISSSGVITFNSAPDYETKTSYSITVNVSDGTDTTSQALAIVINNVNDIVPTISGLSSSISVAENNISVVSVSASDGDGDTLTYSLTGTDASSLSISSSGVITFNSAPDYETKTSYSITVNVSDGTNTTSQALTINITNVNEGAPVISNLASSVSVDEGQTAVVTVAASDVDGDTLAYSLTGTDASSLSISSSGVITFNSAPDYETKTSYSITVNVSDGTDTTSQAFAINITDINDNAPVISGLASSLSVAENQTAVVTVSAADADGNSLTYSLTGTDASSLSINSSGVITFNSAPDYETKNSYSVTEYEVLVS